MVENNLQHFSGIISLKNLVTLCLNKNNIESVFPLTKPQRAQMTRSQYSQRTNSDIDLLHYQEDSPILPKLEVLHLGFNKARGFYIHLHPDSSLRSPILPLGTQAMPFNHYDRMAALLWPRTGVGSSV